MSPVAVVFRKLRVHKEACWKYLKHATTKQSVYEFWSASENARRGQNAFLGFSASVTASITPPGSTHLIATLPHIILLTFLSLYFVILYILNMNFKIFFHQNNFGFLQNSLGASRYKIQILTCYLLPLSFGHALSSLIFNYFRDFLDFQQSMNKLHDSK